MHTPVVAGSLIVNEMIRITLVGASTGFDSHSLAEGRLMGQLHCIVGTSPDISSMTVHADRKVMRGGGLTVVSD